MKLSDFDYCLPKELIAQYPQKERDKSCLLVLDRENKDITHRDFSCVIDYLRPGDLLVLNDTKVLPARVFGRRQKTGAKIEFLFVKEEGGIFSVMVKPAKKFEIGETIIFGENNGLLCAKVIDKNKIAFEEGRSGEIYKLGTMPLPPYIKREAESLDFERYQTVFAKNPGSIAAPTAGLHFTEELLDRIRNKGIEIAYITLHVGTGTFKPVKVEDVAKHEMEPEYFEVSSETIEKIKGAEKAGRRVFAVGSTACRVVEAIVDLPAAYSVHHAAYSGFTNLFIYPGYRFKIVDCLITNFHLPRTTLFMLVCAFCAAGASEMAGMELAKKAYEEAIVKNYRFYSYGDAMLII